MKDLVAYFIISYFGVFYINNTNPNITLNWDMSSLSFETKVNDKVFLAKNDNL